MFTISQISFCVLVALGVTTGKQQVPVCVPAAGQSQQSTGFNKESSEKHIIIKGKQMDSECPLITFHLPRDNQISDYIRYRNYVPRMPSATVCAWIETTDFDDDVNMVASYAVSRSLENAYYLGIDSHIEVRNHIMGPGFVTVVPQLNATDKFHICHWFSSADRATGIYVNGKSISTFGYRGDVLAGGGDFILGQEQDAPNAGGLDAMQSFHGNITNFIIWPRVLTKSEIFEIANSCVCPIDRSMVFSLDRVELFGQASYTIPKTCPTL